MKPPLRYRQIHLDFHTHGTIPGIGSKFEKKAFKESLKRAAVNSITCFATCHHGWSYYETSIGQRHPELNFDLLRAQFEACKEIDINVPIYLTAGVHNLMADTHPEWREVGPDGTYGGWTKSNLEAGFKKMSFHSPYLDYLCSQIQEVMRLFPNADGIFLDIISQGEDCSQWALKHMQSQGLDPLNNDDRLQSRKDALIKYYQRSTEAVRSIDPEMPIFHNSGHITPGYHDILPYFSHLELESLPTGGWGYDHFPLSAKYVHKLDMEYLGMTGKFHSTWGEFGGYKHPNALRYECCAMLAYGAKCSIGDQLHPIGELDESTYEIIGEAYREVAQKERFIEGAINIADIALLSSASIQAETEFLNPSREHVSDTGAARVLLEEHFLFDVIDPGMDFSPYKLLVLPDDVTLDINLETKLKTYVAQGGKLFLSAASGLEPEGHMCFDIGGELSTISEYQPDYALPIPSLQPSFVTKPIVMYERSHRLRVTDGESLGQIHDPYFNRSWDHFCSHQHAPARPEASGYDCGVRKGNILYLTHPVFTIYRCSGQVALRQFIGKSIRYLLDEQSALTLENFPSTARVTLAKQPKEQRYVLHLLNASPINRGGAVELHGGNNSGRQASYEVIEDNIPLHHIDIDISIPEAISGIRLEPEGKDLAWCTSDRHIQLTLPKLEYHQMIVLQY